MEENKSSLKDIIEDARKDARRAALEFQVLRRRYNRLRAKIKGPYTIEMIVLEAQYRRARTAATKARSMLIQLSGRQRRSEARSLSRKNQPGQSPSNAETAKKGR
jgi:hypothetical protein